MSKDIKQKVIAELNQRIEKLESHKDDPVFSDTNNQYEELNQALAKAIGVPLRKELTDLRNFVQEL